MQLRTGDKGKDNDSTDKGKDDDSTDKGKDDSNSIQKSPGDSKSEAAVSFYIQALNLDTNLTPKVDQSPMETLAVGDKLILKESWPLETRVDAEYDAFISAKDKCGLPRIVARWRVRSPYISGFYLEGVTPWFKTSSREDVVRRHIQIPEKRVLQRILFSTKGSPLTSATSPKQLLTALLHGLIGVYVIYL
jgi:hypothetical protein